MTTRRRATADCQRRLLVLWYAGAAPLLAILVAQSVAGSYGARADEAWTWLLPNVMPTLSLVTGVVVTQRRDSDGSTSSAFTYRLAAALSAAYLLLLALVVVAASYADSRLEAMHRANAFLGPIQGLVSSALGAFFVDRKDRAAAHAGRAAQQHA